MIRSGVHGTVQLGKCNDRNPKLPGQTLQCTGYLCNELLTGLHPAGGIHQLQVVHDDQSEILCLLQLSAFGPELRDGDGGIILYEEGRKCQSLRTFYDIIPVLIRQFTGTDRLGVHQGIHCDHTCYQRLLAHLKGEDNRRYLLIQDHVPCHI